MGKFDVARAQGDWEFDTCDQLARFECGGEQALEEVVGSDPALGIGDRCRDHRRAETQHRGRVIRRRIVVGKTAADGATIAHVRIGNATSENGQRWDQFFDLTVSRHIRMACHRADSDHVSRTGNIRQLGHMRQRDETGRRSKSLLHHRQQRLSAREIARIGTFDESGRSAGQARRARKFELIHDQALRIVFEAASTASTIF